MKRVLLWSFRAAFAISWLLLFGYFYTNPFGPVISDVSKRLEAPNRSKTALLIRRKAFDLNFVVEIIVGSKTSTLYTSPDYNTDPTTDWNEKIQWSKDSSLLVFTTDAYSPDFPARAWAFDFERNIAVTEGERIFALLKERNTQ